MSDLNIASDVPQALWQYRFGDAEFDEARLELRVSGLVVELEQKPLQILATLLRHVDEVVTRDELFDAIWGGRRTIDHVLTNAVAKLRKALGANEEARIVTVPRVGYRFVGPIVRIAVGRRMLNRLEFKAGESVPNRPHFLLEAQIGATQGSEVWRARHQKTKELRVFKFSADGERLNALKREATLYRLLRESLGERLDIVTILDWNFSTPPFYLECEYAGESLTQWAKTNDTLKRMAGPERLALFLRIVDVVAAAHSAGVLHKDIKPDNILVAPCDGGWQLRVADFGSGHLLEPGRLEELGITQLGLTRGSDYAGSVDSGTPLYVAPEIINGQSPSVQSDVFALGILLYQWLIADFSRPLTPGWEEDIDDPLLREDIAAATHKNLARRLTSAAELADLLRHLDERRVRREQAQAAAQRAAQVERALQRAKARQPWMIAALVTLVIGLGAGIWQYRDERAARLRAEKEAARAEAINQFLNDDLLGAADPSGPYGEHNPRMQDVLERAATRLDSRFPNEPSTKASIELALGSAYFGLSDYAKAHRFRQQAVDLLTSANGPTDPTTLKAEYQLALTFTAEGQFHAAGALLDRADRAAGSQRGATTQLAYQAHWARATYYKLKNDAENALAEYETTDRLRQALDPTNLAYLFRVRDGLSWCYLRLGRNAEAESVLRGMMGNAYSPQVVGPVYWAQARLDYGAALISLKQFDAAEHTYLSALNRIRESLGADHYFAGITLNELGELYVRQGRWNRAAESYRQAYEIMRRRTGDNGQGTLIALANLGIVQFRTGRLAEAAGTLAEVHDNCATVFGAKSPLAQSVAFYLASSLVGLDRYAQTEGLADGLDATALAAAEPRNDWQWRLQALKGEILLGQGHPAQAIQLLDPAVAAMDKANPAAWDIRPYRRAQLLAKHRLAADLGHGAAP